MLHIAIVEDEAEHARRLREFSDRYAGEHQEAFRVTAFDNGRHFLDVYKDEYELVFLDISMPHLDGMELAKRLRKIDSTVAIVFVTSLANYAVKGYEVDATDFIVKPFTYEEFAARMERILRRVSRRRTSRISIPAGDGIKVLDVQDISYIEIYSHSLIYHTGGGSFETYGKLGALEEDERFAAFIRIGPSHLVNCFYITEIGKDSLTVDGEKLPFSRRRRKGCMQKMASVLGGGF